MRNLENILKLLKTHRGMDFSGYRRSMLERRLQKRIYSTKSNNISNYTDYLVDHPDELDHLIDVFTINVSRFFRNTLTFEYINKVIVPDLLFTKNNIPNNNNLSIRVWSAGCAYGEEAYSMAIILNEFQKKEHTNFSLNIFATDIDKKALKIANTGIYNIKSLKNLKYRLFLKYFTQGENNYVIDPRIRKMVQFSYYDLLDKKRTVPAESIFGGFDIVLCRNVLIYFNNDHQKIIFNKLYKSLNKNGYLVLGEAEVPIEGFKHKFRRENNFCKIYRKNGK